MAKKQTKAVILSLDWHHEPLPVISYGMGNVLYKGHRRLLRVIINFDDNYIRIHDPIRRKTWDTTLDDYENVTGNMKLFLEYCLTHGNAPPENFDLTV